MNIDNEPVLAALEAQLVAAVTATFTGDTTIGSPIIANVSAFTNVSNGLPVFGAGAARGAVVDSFDAGAKTITLSSDLKQTNTGTEFKTGFLEVGRRAVIWTEAKKQPALFIRHIEDEDDSMGSSLVRTTMIVELWVYSNAGENPKLAPDIALNNLVKAIRGSFVPDYPGGLNTLNGNCFWARIEGRSLYYPGDVGGQAIALINVKITVP